MTRFRRLSLVFLLLSMVCLGASKIECNSMPSKFVPPAVRYCVLLPESSTTSGTSSKPLPALYFLHGLGQSAESLFNEGLWNLVDELQQKKRIRDFVIVAPDAGRTFYINSKDGAVRYEDFFLKEFMPAMEKRYHLSHSREERAISGISMGGFGALRLAFEHPELFSAVSAHSAALIEDLPKGSGQSGAGGFIGPAFGRPIDTDFWKKESPFVFARKQDLSGLKIYFDCGDRDDFGFETGAESLHRILATRKVPHEYHIYPGGHDWSYFSEHLPASLEFDSKAFGK